MFYYNFKVTNLGRSLAKRIRISRPQTDVGGGGRVVLRLLRVLVCELDRLWETKVGLERRVALCAGESYQ